MRRQLMPDSPSRRRTTFLVADIHCASCTSFIEQHLVHLHLTPFAIETSTVDHSVAVELDASLHASTIAKALAEAGYRVGTIDPQSRPDQTSPHALQDAPEDEIPLDGLNQTVAHGTRRRQIAEEHARRQRHMEHCDQCRAGSGDVQSHESSLQHGLSGTSETDNEKAANLVIATEPHLVATPIYHASLSISGMSCSSCVGKITDVLEEKSWVRSANVTLLTQSASVEFEAEHDAKELITIIDEIGYEASLEKVETLSPAPTSGPPDAAYLWTASVSIEGMTCRSCVGTITDAVSSFAWTKTVDVNLITNSATIVFENKSHLEELLTAIEDVGYGAKLNSIVSRTERRTSNTHRTLSIRIDGMYCKHCPGRVTEALERLSQRVAIKLPLTTRKPILRMSYTPHAPKFTVRDILSAISAADTALTPAIHHAPSMMERARQMQARVRQRVLRRVVLAAIVAIPTFIIGIVFTSLVPSTNPGRRYLM
ncbi:hypothetical protein LTR78_010841 [Recurvomyces mirabilis]|uniref:HMA domain-containing protein n=1 Tax=Recurvomyces mirabilis TaxID=574656 RepID=A0AAE0TPB4_9PEZI|nr:hypothetical protein LTR78_010841 [Recurvomyces mirabilis]KAK5150335.1 hypothetical protein LTS14_010174 [Recurvomyces mirabilis]